MNTFKATLDTRHQNGVIGPITQFDNATLELQILSGGQVGESWNSPQFELIAMKRDMNPVREVDQDKFTILSNEDHTVRIELKEQFLTCRGTVKMQLIVKDGNRTSTTIFYLSISQSLDAAIIESLKDIKVLDDLDEVVESLSTFEVTAANNEAKRQHNEKLREVAESNRQDEFDKAQSQRDTEFNEKLNEFQEQVSGLKGEKGEKGDKGDKGERGPQGERGENGRDGIIPNLQVGTVTTLESDQQATVVIGGTKENPILDIAIPRGEKGKDGQGGGSGVSASDKVDYMGEQHESLKETNDANVEYLLRKLNTQKYENSFVTATNTYAKQVNHVLLKGVTKYRDKITGEIIDSFQEGRNLELVSVKSPTVTVSNKNLFDFNDLELGKINNYTGKEEPSNVSRRTKNFINVSFNNKFAFSMPGYKKTDGVRYVIIYQYDKNEKFLRMHVLGDNFEAYPNITLLENTYFVKVSIQQQQTNPSDVFEVQLEQGSVVTSYEPPKSHTLTTPSDLTLRGIGNTQDTLDLNTGEYIKRIETRPYQQGDESNAEVLTDKVNTVYKLVQPITTKIDLNNQKVYSYDGTTYYTTSSLDGHPAPILSIDVPTNLSALVSHQRDTIQVLTIENQEIKAVNEAQDTEIALNQDAINFMLFTPTVESLNEGNEEVNVMANYLANQIRKGRLDYTLVISRYGGFKEDIDTILISEGKQDLIK